MNKNFVIGSLIPISGIVRPIEYEVNGENVMLYAIDTVKLGRWNRLLEDVDEIESDISEYDEI